MQKAALFAALLLLAGPPQASADRDIRPVGKILDTVPLRESSSRSPHRPDDLRRPPGRDARHPDAPGTPAHPIHPPRRHGHHRPTAWWPAATTIVREVQPIIIVTTPPAPEPPPSPEPETMWVPPVMGTRIEPGFWDYAVRRVWMGDHWRYEQDLDRPTWVPEHEVRVVEREGYWEPVD